MLLLLLYIPPSTQGLKMACGCFSHYLGLKSPATAKDAARSKETEGSSPGQSWAGNVRSAFYRLLCQLLSRQSDLWYEKAVGGSTSADMTALHLVGSVSLTLSPISSVGFITNINMGGGVEGRRDTGSQVQQRKWEWRVVLVIRGGWGYKHPDKG